MKKRFTESQIIGFLKEAQAGVSVKDLCRKHGFSDAAFYAWQAKFGGMQVEDAKRLKALEAQNAKRFRARSPTAWPRPSSREPANDFMKLDPQEKRIRQLFRLGIFLKGIHAVLEIVGGLLLLGIPLHAFSHLAIWLTQAELLEEPHDLVANYVLHLGTQLSSGSKTFGGAYLLSHGVVKIVLVVALLKDKLWAYPSSLIVLGLFIVYQMYRFTFTHSVALILLTIFDLVVIWLIWREYQIVKSHLKA